MHLKDSIFIQAAPAAVWPFLIEPDKILAWYFPLEEFAFTGEQTTGVGATFYYVEKMPLGSVRLDFEISQWLENQRIAFVMTSGQFLKSDTQSWSIEPEAGGCRFAFDEEAVMPFGFLGRLLGVVASLGSSANVRKMLARLKALAETI